MNYVVFTKANSLSEPDASKTKLRPLSGTLSSLHRSIPLQDLILPHRNYLHQSRAEGVTVLIGARNPQLGQTALTLTGVSRSSQASCTVIMLRTVLKAL